ERLFAVARERRLKASELFVTVDAQEKLTGDARLDCHALERDGARVRQRGGANLLDRGIEVEEAPGHLRNDPAMGEIEASGYRKLVGLILQGHQRGARHLVVDI